MGIVLGLTRPDSGSVSLFGMAPQAVADGAVGTVLPTGSPLDHLKVSERRLQPAG
jgi:hypothetical protein